MGDEKRREIIEAYPSNSYSKKEEKEKEKEEPPKKVEKVITGTVLKRKKSLGKRFMETFISDDVTNVRSYIVNDVLIPAAKDTITDVVQGVLDAMKTGLDIALFGESRRSRSRSGSRSSYVSYNNYSSRDKDRERDRDRDRRDGKRELSNRDRARHNFDDIILETRGEAEEVLSHLADLIIDYGQATVADLYDLVGVTGSFTDNKYGWDDLRGVKPSRTRDGYLLNLPRPIALD